MDFNTARVKGHEIHGTFWKSLCITFESKGGTEREKKGAALVTPIYNGQNELLPFSRQLLFPFAFTLRTLWPSGAVHSQTIIFDGEEVEVLMGSR